MNEMKRTTEAAGVRRRRSFSAATKEQVVLRAEHMRQSGQSTSVIARELGVSEQSLYRWSALSESKSSSRQTMLPVAVVDTSARTDCDSVVVMRLRDGTEVHGLSVDQLAKLLKTLSTC